MQRGGYVTFRHLPSGGPARARCTEEDGRLREALTKSQGYARIKTDESKVTIALTILLTVSSSVRQLRERNSPDFLLGKLFQKYASMTAGVFLVIYGFINRW